jgi:hypothetical protein
VTKRLFETIWTVDQISKPHLEGVLARQGPGKALHHITSLEALERFATEGRPP